MSPDANKTEAARTDYLPYGEEIPANPWARTALWTTAEK